MSRPATWCGAMPGSSCTSRCRRRASPAIRKAEGIWIEDLAGAAVHRFPRQQRPSHRLWPPAAHRRDQAAARRALLHAAPVHLRARGGARTRSSRRSPPANLGKVLFTTGGSDAVEVALKAPRASPPAGARRSRSGMPSTARASVGSSVGGEQLLPARDRSDRFLSGTEHVAPFACYRCAYGYPEHERQTRLGALPHDLRQLCFLCAGARGRRRRRDRAEPARAVPYLAPSGYWRAGARGLQPPARHAPDLRRGPDGLGKTPAACSPASTRTPSPTSSCFGKSAGRRRAADRRRDLPPRARRRRRLGARPLHPREEPGHRPCGAHDDRRS